MRRRRSAAQSVSVVPVVSWLCFSCLFFPSSFLHVRFSSSPYFPKRHFSFFHSLLFFLFIPLLLFITPPPPVFSSLATAISLRRERSLKFSLLSISYSSSILSFLSFLSLSPLPSSLFVFYSSCMYITFSPLLSTHFAF